MNDYSSRFRFYRYEFITTDDFPLLRYILGLGPSPVIEIPCGAGRLLDIHSEHQREVFLVDLEPKMIEICQQEIAKKGLEARIFPVVGNMRDWCSTKKAGLALVPRGGIQLLLTRKDILETFNNLHQNLCEEGLLYLDIADPWGSNPANYNLLPEFMRFKKSRVLRGRSDFLLEGTNHLLRKYISVRYKDYIFVQFIFFVNQSNQIIYRGSYRWKRIEYDDLVTDLNSSGFVIKKIYGDYEFQEYQAGASRIICIAQKEE